MCVWSHSISKASGNVTDMEVLRHETFCPERSCSCAVGEGADNDLVLKEWALYIFHQFNTKILRSSTVPKASVKRGKCWAVEKNFCACALSVVHPNSPKSSSTFSGGNCLLCTLKSLRHPVPLYPYLLLDFHQAPSLGFPILMPCATFSSAINGLPAYSLSLF